MTTYNQYQVSEIKSSYISSIHSQPTTPTAHTHTHTHTTIEKKTHQSNLQKKISSKYEINSLRY